MDAAMWKSEVSCQICPCPCAIFVCECISHWLYDITQIDKLEFQPPICVHLLDMQHNRTLVELADCEQSPNAPAPGVMAGYGSLRATGGQVGGS